VATPDITQAVSLFIQAFGWPETEVKLGPYRCGGKCRKAHAYAWSEIHEVLYKGTMVVATVVFRYYRPHSDHDGYQDVKKQPLPKWLKEIVSATS